MDLNAVVGSGLSFGLVTMVGIAAAYDVGVQRIPNFVTVTGFVLALMLHGLTGVTALLGGLLGAAICFVLFVPIFAIGGLGGGDVKLLTAVGAFLGWQSGSSLLEQPIIVVILATAIIGAVMGVIAAARQRALTSTFLGMRDLVVGLSQRAVSKQATTELPSLDKPGGVRSPYGVAIAAGAIIGLLY